MTTLEDALLTVAEYANGKGERTLADWCIDEREQLTENRDRDIRVGLIAAEYMPRASLSDDELAEMGERIAAAIEAAK
jgi:hypothetical protein